MVGILIALSINNWNEQQKLKVQEIEILKDFKARLKLDLKNFSDAVEFAEQARSSMEIILAHLDADLSYSDTLKFHFSNTTSTWVIQINADVFESLKSEGLTLISNRELRQGLMNLHGQRSKTHQLSGERYRDLMDEASTTILNTRFEEFWKGNYESWGEENDYSDKDFTIDGLIMEMTPIDYEKLKDDQEYLYFLKSLKNRHFWLIDIEHRSYKKAIIKALNMIELELERIE